MAETTCVPINYVELLWPQVRHWIKEAMRRGDLGTFEDVERDVMSGLALLWLAWNGKIEGAAVTQVHRTENNKVCTIVACGGEGRHWIDGIKVIEDYATAEGCDCVRILGRKGWTRLLKDYRVPKVVLEKSLHGRHV